MNGEEYEVTAAKLLVGFLAANALILSYVVPAAAQFSGASTSDSTAASAPMTKAEKKAQRKAARKQARAKNTAELKQLENNGYQPAVNAPNYPQDLQNAEKKANAGRAASQ